jgi:hypothetical protein
MRPVLHSRQEAKFQGLLLRRFEEDQEGQEAKFQYRRHDQVLPALLRRTPGSCRRDYDTSANHEDLQEVKDPRGPVGIHATRKRGSRCIQPLLGGLAK